MIFLLQSTILLDLPLSLPFVPKSLVTCPVGWRWIRTPTPPPNQTAKLVTPDIDDIALLRVRLRLLGRPLRRPLRYRPKWASASPPTLSTAILLLTSRASKALKQTGIRDDRPPGNLAVMPSTAFTMDRRSTRATRPRNRFRRPTVGPRIKITTDTAFNASESSTTPRPQNPKMSS